MKHLWKLFLRVFNRFLLNRSEQVWNRHSNSGTNTSIAGFRVEYGRKMWGGQSVSFPPYSHADHQSSRAVGEKKQQLFLLRRYVKLVPDFQADNGNGEKSPKTK